MPEPPATGVGVVVAGVGVVADGIAVGISAIVGAAVGVVVAVAVTAALWRTEQPLAEGDVSSTRASPANARLVAADVSASSEAELRQTTSGTAGPGDASSPHEPGPAAGDEAELKAAFAELLADPDPDVRREAERLAREFEGLTRR